MSELQKLRPAEAYQEFFVPAIFARWAPVLVGHAKPRPNERALDVACGTGIVARTIAPVLGPEGRLVAVDISPAMLDVARALAPPDGAAIEWVQGEANALPGDGFDLVLCQQGLQFFPDQAAAVAEMKRVLRPDGRAVVSVWQGLERQPIYHALCEAEARHLGLSLEEVATPFIFGDAAKLERLFAAAGFRSVRVVDEARDVRFPSADQFVARTFLAAAAVMPTLADLSDRERTLLVRAMTDDLRSILATHTRGVELVFPTYCNIAVAYA